MILPSHRGVSLLFVACLRILFCVRGLVISLSIFSLRNTPNSVQCVGKAASMNCYVFAGSVSVFGENYMLSSEVDSVVQNAIQLLMQGPALNNVSSLVQGVQYLAPGLQTVAPLPTMAPTPGRVPTIPVTPAPFPPTTFPPGFPTPFPTTQKPVVFPSFPVSSLHAF